ncbi:MAG: TrkH family potassium uptake protein [Desulfobacteraceae bacterium]|jgi:trk system potassium uptake protein TrkH|nr:TrkH family potassium uptake protein [Desulfobacteraceae bacterium]
MRNPAFLRARYAGIIRLTGGITGLIGLVLLSPLAGLFFFPEEAALAGGFALPGVIVTAVGGLLVGGLRSRVVAELTYAEGATIIVMAWLTAVVAGAVPFWMLLELSFTQALFESTSGWTTTGLSVLDVAAAPRLILLFRSILQYTGGAGFAVIMLSALAGPAGTGIGAAEGRPAGLAPNVRRSAELVLKLYSGYALCGILALHLAGMGWFDAVNHALTAVSTGGFSTRPESIGYWNSPSVEAVTIVLMLLGGTNFLTAYMLLTGHFAYVRRNGELHLLLILVVVGVPLILLTGAGHLYPSWPPALRSAVFETVSALSTTGFSTTGYGGWNAGGLLLLTFLMVVGGGTGSTAGGIKLHRVYLLIRGLVWEFRRQILPEKAVSAPYLWQGNQRRFITDDELRHSGLFLFLYLCCWASGSLVVCSWGYPVADGLFEFASAVGTVGLSVGVTTAGTPPAVLWTQIGGMLLGRLEFFTVILGVIKLVRDARVMLRADRSQRR